MENSDDKTEMRSGSEGDSKMGTRAEVGNAEISSSDGPKLAHGDAINVSKRASHLDFLDDDEDEDEDELAFASLPRGAGEEQYSANDSTLTMSKQESCIKSTGSSIHSLFGSSEEHDDVSFGNLSTTEARATLSTQNGTDEANIFASRSELQQAEKSHEDRLHQTTGTPAYESSSPSAVLFSSAGARDRPSQHTKRTAYAEPPKGVGFINSGDVTPSADILNRFDKNDEGEHIEGNSENVEGPSLYAEDRTYSALGSHVETLLEADIPRGSSATSGYCPPSSGIGAQALLSHSEAPTRESINQSSFDISRSSASAHAAKVAGHAGVVTGQDLSGWDRAEPSLLARQSGPASREDPVKFVQKLRESRIVYKPLVVSLNNSVVLYKRIRQQRYVGGVVVQKDINVFTVEPVRVPKARNIIVEDRLINRLLDANLSEKTPLAKIESYLEIVPGEVMQEDMNIEKTFINELLQTRGTLICEDFCKTVLNNTVRDALVVEMLKVKLGIPIDPKSLKSVRISSSYLTPIVALNNSVLTRLFIESQSNFMAYFTVFYKLNLVSIMEFASTFYNNLYYLAVLERISRGEDLSLLSPSHVSSAEKPGWSFKSVLDFGISRILSVETGTEKAEELDPYKNIVVDGKDKGAESGTHAGLGVSDSPVTGPVPSVMLTDLPQRLGKISVGGSNLSGNAQQGGDNEDSFADRINMTPEKKSELKSIFEDNDDVDIFDNPVKSSNKRADEVGDSESLGNLSDDVFLRKNLKGEDLKETVSKDESGRAVSGCGKPEKSERESQGASPIYGNDQGAVSSEDLSQSKKQQPTYRKKFAKSFADIFSLGSGGDGRELDVSSYVDDVEENDKPMLVKEYEEESKPSFFNVFGMFRKKEKPANAAPAAPRPPRAAIKIPEKPKGPSVIKDLYANKKSPAIEIPGAGAPTVKRHVLNPDRTQRPAANLSKDGSENNSE